MTLVQVLHTQEEFENFLEYSPDGKAIFATMGERVDTYLSLNVARSSEEHESDLKTGYIGLQDVQELLEYIAYTSYLKNERAVSAMVIGEPSNGKSSVCDSLEGKKVYTTADLSQRPLYKEIIPKIKNQEINCVVVRDWTTVLSHHSQTANSVHTAIGRLIEDGFDKSNFNEQQIDLGGLHYCQFITTITTKKFREMFRSWEESGDLSRWLPVSWKYSPETIGQIQKLQLDRDKPQKLFPIRVRPTNKKSVEIPNEIKPQLIALTNDVLSRLNRFEITIYDENRHAHQITISQKPLRLQRQLAQVLRAVALCHGRKIVAQEDFNRLKELSLYIGYPNTAVMIDPLPLDTNPGNCQCGKCQAAETEQVN